MGANEKSLTDIQKENVELQEEVLKLKKEIKLFNALIENIPDTIYFKDEECKFIKINKAQASALGVKKPEDAIGLTDFNFFNIEHAEKAYFDEKNIIRTGKMVINKEEKIQKGNGKWFWVTATKVPMRDDKGKIIGIAGISRDISKYKKA